jgi:hypothetical protein
MEYEKARSPMAELTPFLELYPRLEKSEGKHPCFISYNTYQDTPDLWPKLECYSYIHLLPKYGQIVTW